MVVLGILLGAVLIGGYTWLVFQGASGGARPLTNFRAQLSEWAASTELTCDEWLVSAADGQAAVGRDMLRSIRGIDRLGEPSTDHLAPFTAAVTDWCSGLGECTTFIAAYLPGSSCAIDTAAEAAVAAYLQRPAGFRGD